MDRSSIAVIELAGDINGHVLEELSALIGALIDQHRRHVVVNMSGLARCGQGEFESLVERAKQLRSIGGDLKIVGRDVVPSALETRAASFFKPYESLEAALNGFTGESAVRMAPAP